MLRHFAYKLPRINNSAIPIKNPKVEGPKHVSSFTPVYSHRYSLPARTCSLSRLKNPFPYHRLISIPAIMNPQTATTTTPTTGGYTTRPLYGGALTTLLPSTLLDASSLRQIPDHQEVFLSRTTLATVVFEINQFVDAATIRSADRARSGQADGESGLAGHNGMRGLQVDSGIGNGGGAASASGSNAPDEEEVAASKAAMYHLSDLLAPGDVLVEKSVPRAVEMQGESLRGMRAVLVGGTIGPSPGADRGEGGLQTLTSVKMLLVRLERYGTDLCVVANVPWRELVVEREGDGDGGGKGRKRVEEEEGWADEVLDRVGESLEVLDWGLFGEAEVLE